MDVANSVFASSISRKPGGMLARPVGIRQRKRLSGIDRFEASRDDDRVPQPDQ